MQNFSRTSKHARSFEFTKKHLIMYQDNSLDKATRVRSFLDSRGTEFRKKERILKDLIQKKEKIKVRKEIEGKLKEIIDSNLKGYNDWHDKLNVSALTIQKCVRGYLVRKKCQKIFAQKVKNHAVQVLNTMQKMIYSMWIDLKYFKEPVKVIEDHYFRYLARKKISIISDLYTKYCYNRKAERFRVFEYLQHIIARERIWQKKQPIIIKRRLEAIRKNLSLLKVKYYWNKNKLTPIKIIAKAKKLKKIINSTYRPKRTLSVYKEYLPSPFIWRYSMITLPIVYSDNILLGSDPPSRIKRTKSKVMGKNFTRKNFSPIYMNFPKISSSTNKNMVSQRPNSRNTTVGANKVEVIQYHSPMAESLGYRSFHLKVWKPIFTLNVLKTSCTPTLQRSKIIKTKKNKPQSLLPIRVRKQS